MTVDELAERYQLHRTTVMRHLSTAGIETRRIARKLTDDQVRHAAQRYHQEGLSLEELAEAFAVNSETIRREFIKAGVARRDPGRRRGR
jgi:DNA-binding transcriptional regulator LsrR (DeoR family)